MFSVGRLKEKERMNVFITTGDVLDQSESPELFSSDKDMAEQIILDYYWKSLRDLGAWCYERQLW